MDLEKILFGFVDNQKYKYFMQPLAQPKIITATVSFRPFISVWR